MNYKVKAAGAGYSLVLGCCLMNKLKQSPSSQKSSSNVVSTGEYLGKASCQFSSTPNSWDILTDCFSFLSFLIFDKSFREGHVNCQRFSNFRQCRLFILFPTRKAESKVILRVILRVVLRRQNSQKPSPAIAYQTTTTYLRVKAHHQSPHTPELDLSLSLEE